MNHKLKAMIITALDVDLADAIANAANYRDNRLGKEVDDEHVLAALELQLLLEAKEIKRLLERFNDDGIVAYTR